MSMSAPQSRAEVTPRRILEMAFGYAAPLMLEAAVRHRVFDVLDRGPQSLEEVAGATGASARGLRALLDGLVGLEFLARQNGRYTLTPESAAFLVRGKPGNLGGFLDHTSTHLLPKWLHLNEAVRTGLPAVAVNEEGEGARFFEQFVEDLFALNYKSAQALADELGVARATGPVRVLDLAAGSGVWSIALAEKSPQVRVRAVDWAGVIPVTRRVAVQHGVADRYEFVAGDLREADFGSAQQVATLGHILHSEGEERSRALLRKTAAALAPGGTIAIAEWLVNEERTGPPGGLIFAVNMLVNTQHGDTFSFGQIQGWLQEAGFGKARTLEVSGPSPLVLAEKVG
jgi:SAM-dependent methyltransferase